MFIVRSSFRAGEAGAVVWLSEQLHCVPLLRAILTTQKYSVTSSAASAVNKGKEHK